MAKKISKWEQQKQAYDKQLETLYKACTRKLTLDRMGNVAIIGGYIHNSDKKIRLFAIGDTHFLFGDETPYMDDCLVVAARDGGFVLGASGGFVDSFSKPFLNDSVPGKEFRAYGNRKYLRLTEAEVDNIFNNFKGYDSMLGLYDD